MTKYILLIVILGIVNVSHCQQLEAGISLLEKCREFYNQLEYDSAFAYGKKGFDIFETLRNDSLQVASAIMLYRSADKLIDQKTADDYITIAENIAQKNKRQTLWIETLYAKGNMLYYKEEHAAALPLFLKIDSISKEYSIINATTINAIIQRSEISRLKFTNDNIVIAHKLLLEALDMSRRIKSEEMINLTYTYLANTAHLLDKLDETKEYIDLAFEYYLKIDDVKNISQLHLLNTSYYLALDDLVNAKKSQEERIAYLRTKRDKIELARALSYSGSFHRRKTKEYTKAIKSLEEAKAIYESIGRTKIDAYERVLYSMAICYYYIEDYKSAFEFFDQAYDLREDLLTKANKDLTSELETKYQTEKKEQEINLLTTQNKLTEREKANQRNLFGILFCSILIIAGFLIYGYRNKLKTARKLKELDELKSRFFANISHEFRTPLTLIKSPLQQLQRNEIAEDSKKYLDLIDQNSNRMLTLVDQLLELSKLDAGNLKPVFKKGQIFPFLKSLAEPFKFEAKMQDIEFKLQIQQTDDSHWYDKDIVEKIVSNLLSNALKYTTSGQEVIFTSAVGKNRLSLSVSNSGVYLKQSEVNRLFERFYRQETSKQGAGIGLALVKELVTLYKGDLKAELNNGVLTISVYLPTEKQELTSIGILSNSSEEKTATIVNEKKTGERPVLLLADDNEDIRLVLKGIFKDEFHVFEAENGEKALKIAQKEVPDIVISDVMMPGMDGLEFCRQIKKSEITSFIPVILLTAKTGDQSHLSGLQSDADAFITKPFNHDILIAKVRQLLSERRKLRDRYSKELVLKPVDIVLNSVDEKFINRLQEIIDNHLSNPEFSSDDFSKEAGMSRMQLHRKLKSLTGFSASEFIRKERLKVATQLLLKDGVSVAEVAYAVGFNDADYFSKCFKEEYGTTPSHYRDQQ